MKKNLSKLLASTLAVSSILPAATALADFSDVKSEAWYKTWVDKAVNNELMAGFPDGTFKPTEGLTRAQLAAIMVNVLGLQVDAAAASKFTDVNAEWSKDYIGAVVKNGVFAGTSATTFSPDQLVDRQTLATVLVNALGYGDEAKELALTPKFADASKVASWAAPYVAFAGEIKLMEGTGTNFEPTVNASRADAAAVAVKYFENVDTYKEEAKKLYESLTIAVVESVVATNPTTLTVTGTGLKTLSADSLSLVGNKVNTVTASADGKSATLTLDAHLTPNADVTLTWTAKDGTTKDFTTKFEYKVTSVSIADQAFDDDRAGQTVAFKVNNESANADVEYLLLAGYDVNFVAKDANGAAYPLFDGGFNTSSTGELDTALAKGTYTVEVQVIKSGEALVTDTATIKIVNIDQDATAVKDVVFANAGSNDTVEIAYEGSFASLDDFQMASTTLVAGEKAVVYSATATIAGEDTSDLDGVFSVKTSNPAVVSVNNGVLTAESAGTATITVTVGSVSKTFNFTVTNTDRVLNKVTFSPTSVKVATGSTASVTLTAVDQYNDRIVIDNTDLDVTGTDVVTTTLPATFTNGRGTVTFTPVKKGSGSVVLKPAGNASKILGSIHVEVTDVINIAKQELVNTSETGESKDNTLDLSADTVAEYTLKNYNPSGVYLGDVDLVAGGYTVEAASTVATAAIVGNEIVVTGARVGKTDILLKDSAGAIVKKVTVTVVNNEIGIQSVAFKSVPAINYAGRTIKYTDVLSVETSVNDDIVKGITLNKSTLHKVRIDEATGMLYLDVNGDAGYLSADGDIELGTLILTETADSNFASGNDPIAGFTTASGDKGTLLFKVQLDPADTTTSIAATSVSINVQ